VSEERQVRGRKFPHLPLRSPTERESPASQAWGLPGVGASQQLHSPGKPETNVPAIRERTFIGCLLCTRLPTPRTCQLPEFGKTCPSCLLGQIPGQAARPAGKT
jgi:hypothetical protein